MAFVLLAGAVLYLHQDRDALPGSARRARGIPNRRRAGHRTRHRRDRDRRRRRGHSPASRRLRRSARASPGSGRASMRRCSSATICVGRASTEVLRLHTDAPTPPYLRADDALACSTGAVWQPDRMRAVPLESERRPRRRRGRPRTSRCRSTPPTSRCANSSPPWLPVAFPPSTSPDSTATWKVVPYNRTVLSQSGSTRGQTYEVVTHVPRPTLEQIRATEAGGPQIRDDTTALPPDMPPIIGETRRRGHRRRRPTTTTRSIALQRWFRGSDFRYSLDAPGRGGLRRQRHRRGGEVPRGERGLLRALRVGLRAHGAHARHAHAHRRRLPARARTTERRPIDRRQTVYSVLEQPAARLARGVLRRHRLGAVRAHRRPRRADQLLSGIDDARRSRRGHGRHPDAGSHGIGGDGESPG